MSQRANESPHENSQTYSYARALTGCFAHERNFLESWLPYSRPRRPSTSALSVICFSMRTENLLIHPLDNATGMGLTKMAVALGH